MSLVRWLGTHLALRQPAQYPAQYVVAGFVLASLIGALLLLLPAASQGGGTTSFLTALFTATSAVCVTGLTVVDTAGNWSTFGEVVILALIQMGGFGIMSLTSIIVLVMARRLGLRHRLVAAAETGSLDTGDVRRVLFGIAKLSVGVEVVVAAALFLRFWLAHGYAPGQAAYLGLFHSVSAFNNAGFGLFPDSLTRYATDPFLLIVIALTVIVGGLGFPVLVQDGLTSRWGPLQTDFGRQHGGPGAGVGEGRPPVESLHGEGPNRDRRRPSGPRWGCSSPWVPSRGG